MVGIGQAGGQGGFHGAEFHGVGTWFEYGENARVADALAQAADGGGDGGGVVGEVVVHGDAAHAAFDFHAPFDVLEGG